MTAYYFDTSGLIKRYVTETGSDWVNQLFQPENGHFFIPLQPKSLLGRAMPDWQVRRQRLNETDVG